MNSPSDNKFRVGELIEQLDDINKWLARDYPKHIDGRPMFRVVWSDDQLEKRWMTHTNEGFQLLYPEVREVPKYRQYIQERYILERIVTIVPGVETDLVEREPYEVLWVFQDRYEQYLPPRYDVCKIILEQVFEAAKGSIGPKYKDGMNTEQYLKDIQDMEEKLFGNETPVTDALSYGYGVVVPGQEKNDG